MESQITLLIWSCSNHLQKNIAQLITWSISKFYQCSIWGFCWSIFMFFSICLGKKIADVIKFLGISQKKYVSENKIYFCSRKKSNVSLNKKVIFVFHTIFKLDFITQIIYWINPSLPINLTKVQQQNEWKKKPGIWEYGPWVCNWAN